MFLKARVRVSFKKLVPIVVRKVNSVTGASQVFLRERNNIQQPKHSLTTSFKMILKVPIF